jgi:hypothetical protein
VGGLFQFIDIPVGYQGRDAFALSTTSLEERSPHQEKWYRRYLGSIFVFGIASSVYFFSTGEAL